MSGWARLTEDFMGRKKGGLHKKHSEKGGSPHYLSLENEKRGGGFYSWRGEKEGARY